jgi:hypothetical protein
MGNRATMWILRRLIPQMGFLTVAGLAWNHRATVARTVELATEVPRILREDGPSGLVEHGKRLIELDRSAPTDLRVRLEDRPLSARPATT